MYQRSFSQTITEVINKGKDAIYLVLKQKPFHIEIYDNLKIEVEQRFKTFLNRKLPLLKQANPENREIFFECFLIRAMIEVLKQMLKERQVMLSERDKNLFRNIFSKNYKNGRIYIEDDDFFKDDTIENNDYFIKSIENLIKDKRY